MNSITVKTVSKWILIAVIRVYQFMVSPFFPPTCRYYPTCSSYCIEALEKYGFPKGWWLGVKRVLRCHPFHAGGYDPVP